MLNTNIADGTGTKTKAKVSSNHALLVSVVPPVASDTPVGTPNAYKYLASNLGLAGMNTGAINMNIDGSVTEQIFYAASAEDYDFYVQAILILIADSSITHNSFGNVGVLTNGWSLRLVEEGDNTYLLRDVKTGGQILAYAGMTDVFAGSSTEVNEIGNWTGNTDAMVCRIPVSDYIPGGIRIGRGTENRIESVINDDLSTLNEFEVRLFGYRSY